MAPIGEPIWDQVSSPCIQYGLWRRFLMTAILWRALGRENYLRNVGRPVSPLPEEIRWQASAPAIE